MENYTLKKCALEAIQNLLKSSKDVMRGNAVSHEGSLYPDIELGLQIADFLIRKEEEELGDYLHHADEV